MCFVTLLRWCLPSYKAKHKVYEVQDNMLTPNTIHDIPTILLVDGFRFFFYSNEHLPRHVHVSRGGANAIFWLEPDISEKKSHGFTPRELRRIVDIIDEHQESLIDRWNEHFNQ